VSKQLDFAEIARRDLARKLNAARDGLATAPTAAGKRQAEIEVSWLAYQLAKLESAS